MRRHKLAVKDVAAVRILDETGLDCGVKLATQ